MRTFDRVVKRTARRISRELNQMVADLSPEDAPQAAIEIVVMELAHLQPWFMRHIMENPNLKESYEMAVSQIPATPKHGG